jgi:hypothetical protein
MRHMLLACLCAALCAACGQAQEKTRESGAAAPKVEAASVRNDAAKTVETPFVPHDGANVDKEAALSIAREDAVKVYGSLERFDVYTLETKRMWYVIFELKDERLNGGGPQYVISKRTGMILDKKYNQ